MGPEQGYGEMSWEPSMAALVDIGCPLPTMLLTIGKAVCASG